MTRKTETQPIIDEVKQFADKPIDQIMDMARQTLDSYRQSRKEFCRILSYLKRTWRFRELPQYSKSSFEKFLESEFRMTMDRFNQMKIAMEKYENQVILYGQGFVEKTISNHGPDRAALVFKAIEKKQSSRKKPIHQSEMEAISARIKATGADKARPATTHAAPRENPRTDWQYLYDQAVRKITELECKLAEEKDRGKKLMASLGVARKEVEQLKQENNRLKQDQYSPLPEFKNHSNRIPLF